MEEMNQQDRDTLIRLDTKVDIILSKFGSIESKANEVPTIKDEVNRLRANGNLKDFIIAVGTILVGIISFLK